ncbi:uncharacterized protein LAESUDRAFT_763596 [Laetiporus sulphureus 93-53]|uniref:F-box domain-containing protein n=1 Tax=Laetiporus sulphureus 93-53 TaxID=1314785 RepID=A0A165BSZ0_9APHY|nr:uncharacterized protein LAESUDRAFT_763596 [Laetiporus sulphureus 93-53]KZT01591.1 hypothetical protein LAESUDRAFT_763596 [Laetiporus sulphureus 93-53]
MNKFPALEPVRLYASSGSTLPSARRQTVRNVSSTSKSSRGPAPFQLIGRLPAELHILILTHLAVPDLPAYALCSRALAKLVRDERVWEIRWAALGVDQSNLGGALDILEERSKSGTGAAQGHLPPKLTVDIVDDDFGEFAAVDAKADEMGDFIGSFSNVMIHSPRSPGYVPELAHPSLQSRYIHAHKLLKSLIPALSAPPHAVLSALFPLKSPLRLRQQAHILRILSLFLSPRVKPVRAWETLSSALRAAIDRFEDALLTAFDTMDGKGDEAAMREVAEASWEMWDRNEGEWELGTMWTEKREIFYEQSKWKPLDNFTKDQQLDFNAMDAFITEVLAALKEHGSRAARVFPPETRVLLSFADRLANDVVGEYTSPLLTRAREVSNETFLKASAASFKEAWRMVDMVTEVAAMATDALVTRMQAEDVVYRMFEVNMDEYLDEEVEFVKQSFEKICRSWDDQVSQQSAVPSKSTEHIRFIGSQNPAQVKRTVLASFTDVLLLPVTIVPRTVGKAVNAIASSSNAAVQGISMLNPQRWSTGSSGAIAQGGSRGFGRLSGWGSNQNDKNWYMRDFEKGGDETLFEIGEFDEDEKDESKHAQDEDSSKDSRSSMSSTTTVNASRTASTSPSSRRSTPRPPKSDFDKLDLLLSLDIALELIHADRESLKRVETFSGYPGQYGHRVRDTIEDIFVLMLQALSDRHIRPGFERAIEQMKLYQPAEHEKSQSVAPLLQFFELVHIGDTIQSMVQVYFDKDIAPHIDRTDFLNTVVREKKRFEDVLDDSVAAGLNAGTDALMNQVEHIILKLTKPREYYPADDTPLELGPTQGCVEAIGCLKMHCQLLKGSTSKEVLEVFYQEIGIRLIAILQKHLKRQIISLNGGFQVIADLNAYYSFITSLKVPTIASEFSYLKMLGHVYIVDDAKDLAQIVRDVTRYGGAYRPEDVYEFIQRRADWKKIEKTVDKTMYNLSFKEDCIIS